MNNIEFLFSNTPWELLEQNIKKMMFQEISKIDDNRLLNTAQDDFVHYFVTKYQIDVPTLIDEKISIDTRETQIDVSQEFNRPIRDRSRPCYITGTAYNLHIPFRGDAEVFRIRPTTYTMNPPRAHIGNNSLRVTVEGVNLGQDRVKNDFGHSLTKIREHLESLRASAEKFTAVLTQSARNTIESRKNKLLSDQKIAASLGFPIRERADSPRTYAAPEVRRKIEPELSPAASSPYIQEPVLTEAIYEYIIRIIQHMAHAMERSPSSFTSLNEEALRHHVLSYLNGRFEGQATGETFNKHGKTDILVRSGDRNIFIAECKFWGGPKMLSDAIDQLLSYSSWRDTKVAMIIFNRNKNFSQVLESIAKHMVMHPNFKRDLGKSSETVFRYVFSHKDDANRELYLSVIAFDVPVT